MITRKGISTSILAVLALTACLSASAQSVLWGPQTFTRQSETRRQLHRVTFDSPSARQAILWLQNGTPGKITDRVVGVQVMLNGRIIVKTISFNKNTIQLDVPVQLRAGSNTLDIQLQGREGNNFTASILVQPVVVRATVNHPANVGPLTVFTVAGEDTTDSGGAFDVPVSACSRTMAVAEDSDGNPLLMGWLDANGGCSLDARSTAEVLLFVALGVGSLPSEQIQRAISLIEIDPATDTLAGMLSQILAANPGALYDGSPDVPNALRSVLDDFWAENSPGGYSILGSIIDPPASTVRSGLFLQELAGRLNTFQMVNRFRRRAWMFVEKKAEYFDGGMTNTYPPGTAPVYDAYVEPTTGLQTLLDGLRDIPSGNLAYAEKPQKEFTIPVTEDDMLQKTELRVLVVGPGGQPGDPMIGLTSTQIDKQFLMTVDWLICDSLVPLILTAAGAPKPGDLSPSARRQLVQGIIEGLSSREAELRQACHGGNWQLAKSIIIDGIRNSGAIRDAICYHLTNLIGRAGFITNVKYLQQKLLVILSALGAADFVLSSGDVAATTTHVMQSNQAEEWIVTVTPIRVTLSPEEQDLQSGWECSLTVTVKDGAEIVTEGLEYNWCCSGTPLDAIGHLYDAEGIPWTGCYQTTSRTVKYKATSGRSGDVSISCAVRQRDANGQWKTLKTVNGVIHVTPRVGNGELVCFSRVYKTSYNEWRMSKQCGVLFDLIPGAGRHRVCGYNFYDPYYWHAGFDQYWTGNPTDWVAEKIPAGKGYFFLTGGEGPCEEDSVPDFSSYYERFRGAIFEIRSEP